MPYASGYMYMQCTRWMYPFSFCTIFLPHTYSCSCNVDIFQVYFGTQHAKMYLNADFLGINCVTGMSCLFRKNIVEEAGGLRALGEYLAEDYYLGQAFLDRWVDDIMPYSYTLANSFPMIRQLEWLINTCWYYRWIGVEPVLHRLHRYYACDCAELLWAWERATVK